LAGPKIKLRAGFDAFWSQWTVHIVLWLTVKIWPQILKILCCFEVDFRLFQGSELHMPGSCGYRPKCTDDTFWSGEILRSEGYVCANPGKFGVISDKMYMLNPGNSRYFSSGFYHGGSHF
jgi:hypothetical protein